jgi:hypothetical protein
MSYIIITREPYTKTLQLIFADEDCEKVKEFPTRKKAENFAQKHLSCKLWLFEIVEVTI